jgi:hypothetical protein
MFRNAARSIYDSVQGTCRILSPSTSSPWLKNTLWSAAFSVPLLTGLFVYGVFTFGSVGAFVSAIRGRVLYVTPARSEIDPLKPGESSIVTVRIRNLATGPIKVLGSRAQPQ